MTLAHFGFGKNGEVLDDSQLPASLTGDWLEAEGNQGKPFPSYARLLAKRGTADGESCYSWTIDFVARRAKAREEMQPHLEESQRLKAQVVTLKEQLKSLKKEKTKRKDSATLEERIRDLEKVARDAKTKADDIDAAVYDLKAVNPNAVAKGDTRSPAEIIENIGAQGEIVAAALARLRVLMSGG